MWHTRQADLSSKLANLMEFGALDIYLFEEELKDMTINKILEATSEFLESNNAESEHLIPGVACLVFDPTGNIQLRGYKTSYPEIRTNGSIAALLHDCKYDRSLLYEKKFRLKKPTTRVAHITSPVGDTGKREIKITRVMRPSEDKRITQKIIEEAMQLSKHYPGIVVFEMGGPSAKIGYWANLSKELFNSRIYNFPSAVWFRYLHLGIKEFAWSEVIVINPYASRKLPEGLINAIMPTGRMLEEIDSTHN